MNGFLFADPANSHAQVYGIPDEKYGEIYCAWAVAAPGPSLTENDVCGFWKDHIVRHKVPTHVRVVPGNPIDVTDKPRKFVTRDKMTEILSV